jgi:hypothetical protein
MISRFSHFGRLSHSFLLSRRYIITSVTPVLSSILLDTHKAVHYSELNVNSAIAKPAHGETLFVPSGQPSDEQTPNNTYAVRGFAYAGGGRRINRVEISLDDGHTWTLAEMYVASTASRSIS